MARAWLQNERAVLMAQLGQHREAPAGAPTLQVLVARNAIHTGQIVKPDDMRWQSWPQGSLAQTYIVEGKRPLSDFVGAVVRGAIAAGEPITEGKLVLAGTRGFMAAVLQPGTRAVSVPITATTAVSGFIYAGDRVDVLLTHVLVPIGQNGQAQQRNNTARPKQSCATRGSLPWTRSSTSRRATNLMSARPPPSSSLPSRPSSSPLRSRWATFHWSS